MWTVDERGSSTYGPDQADQQLQEPQWPTPTSNNPVGNDLGIRGGRGYAAAKARVATRALLLAPPGQPDRRHTTVVPRGDNSPQFC
jgi:hypothetical protein